MDIHCIENGAFAANCYLLAAASGEALVIDPGAEGARIADKIRELDLTVAGYPLTHGHIDHIGALREVHDAFPAPVALHNADAAWAFHEQNGFPPYYAPLLDPPPVDHGYAEETPESFGPFTFRILHTPGHSPGGVLFLFEKEKVMISGDTLFAGSIGRVDLPGSDPSAMMESLKKFQGLDPEYTVYPGHGPSTTLGHELKTNPYLLQAGRLP